MGYLSKSQRLLYDRLHHFPIKGTYTSALQPSKDIPKTTILKRQSSGLWGRAYDLRQLLEFKIISSFFIDEHKLPRTFDFAHYLAASLGTSAATTMQALAHACAICPKRKGSPERKCAPCLRPASPHPTSPHLTSPHLTSPPPPHLTSPPVVRHTTTAELHMIDIVEIDIVSWLVIIVLMLLNLPFRAILRQPDICDGGPGAHASSYPRLQPPTQPYATPHNPRAAPTACYRATDMAHHRTACL